MGCIGDVVSFLRSVIFLCRDSFSRCRMRTWASAVVDHDHDDDDEDAFGADTCWGAGSMRVLMGGRKPIWNLGHHLTLTTRGTSADS